METRPVKKRSRQFLSIASYSSGRMTAGAGLYYNLLLASVQLAAAIVIARATMIPRGARGWAAALVGANALVSLFHGWEITGGGLLAQRLVSAADGPTPLLIFGLLLWFPEPRAWSRWRMAAGVALAVVAVALAVRELFAAAPGLDNVVTIGGTFASYIAAVALLTSALVRRASWAVEWALAAFLLRSADFAVRWFPTSAPTEWPAMAPVLLAITVVSAVVAILWFRPGESRGGVPVAFALLGAALGGVGRVLSHTGIGWEESFLTLAIGRPALLVIAFTLPGVVRPFFRGMVVGAVPYFLAIHAATTLGLEGLRGPFPVALIGIVAAAATLAGWWFAGRGPRAEGVALTELSVAPKRTVEQGRAALPDSPPDWQRLVDLLAASPKALTRAEIAQALGILPRNVQRVVDAANRSSGAGPGHPVIEAEVARGRSNQWQYHYALVRPIAASRESLPATRPADEKNPSFDRQTGE